VTGLVIRLTFARYPGCGASARQALSRLYGWFSGSGGRRAGRTFEGFETDRAIRAPGDESCVFCSVRRDGGRELREDRVHLFVREAIRCPYFFDQDVHVAARRFVLGGERPLETLEPGIDLLEPRVHLLEPRVHSSLQIDDLHARHHPSIVDRVARIVPR
jgi:hypothetical protein